MIMTRKIKIDNESVARILRTVPINNGFMFFTDIGEYTGEYATSLGDFCSKIETIPMASIAFHFGRGDYEKWSKDTLGDEYLAQKFSEIKRSPEEEKLRNSVQRVARRRLNQLERQLQ
jgi:hypothetical protein